jgi:acyl-CoA synthetase (AMP-forming)/AMP-acid ligase II
MLGSTKQDHATPSKVEWFKQGDLRFRIEDSSCISGRQKNVIISRRATSAEIEDLLKRECFRHGVDGLCRGG